MNEQLLDTARFMRKGGQDVRPEPNIFVTEDEARLRLHLIHEELQELSDAIGMKFSARNHTYVSLSGENVVEPNYVEVLDALTDILYVVYGAYHTFGLAEAATLAWEEVQNSNMSKFPPDGKVIKDANGKVLKPDTYFKPNLKKVLDDVFPF